MRARMTLDLSGPVPWLDGGIGGSDPLVRRVEASDAAELAALMLSAYRGTVDDAGEGPEECAAEVAKLLSGGYGALDFAASEVTVREGRVVAATLVTDYQGGAMVAFSLTEPAWQRRGLARAGLMRVAARLRGTGRDRVDLAVTRANTPAVTLYTLLGFREVHTSGQAAGE